VHGVIGRKEYERLDKLDSLRNFKTAPDSNSPELAGYVPERDKERLLEWAWDGYQVGQGSADHTDKQVFQEIIGNLMDCITGT
jgi:hypothetical protein